MAALRPVWASEVTSYTPCSPRAFGEGRNFGPERSLHAVADDEAQDFPSPVRTHAGGDHDGLGRRREPWPPLPPPMRALH